MLNYLLRPNPDLVGFLLEAVAFILALSLHEFGHAFAATAQGDPTAKLAGRLTLNPLKHLDAVGSFMLIMVGFGWGKPVPFAPNKLRNQRFGAALVGIAGPVVNVILAFVSALIMVQLINSEVASLIAFRFLLISLTLNIGLAVFNMMPIPPLDGSRVLSALLPPSKQHIIYFLDKWGFVILLIFVFFLFRPIAGPIINWGIELVARITGLNFGSIDRLLIQS